jgi:hypothetical protein
MSGAGTESLADCQKSFRRTFCSELIAVVSLLSYFLCVITILTAVAGVIVGLVNISTSERVSHYPHPRPEVERNDRELRLLPKTKYGSPAKGTEVTHIHKKVLLREARTAATNSVRSSS